MAASCCPPAEESYEGPCVESVKKLIQLISPFNTAINSTTAVWPVTSDGPHATPDLSCVVLVKFPLQLPPVRLLGFPVVVGVTAYSPSWDNGVHTEVNVSSYALCESINVLSVGLTEYLPVCYLEAALKCLFGHGCLSPYSL